VNNTAVVILNYNGRELLRKFLPSVIRYSGSASIVVVDNYSTDASVELLKNEFPSVSVIVTPSNLGFCGGYNFGLARLKATYFILLNSDVEVTEGWLEPLVEHMNQHPEAGAIQPKILSYTERNRFEYAGAGGGYIDALGYPFCRGRIFDTLEEDRGQYDDTRQVFWASGACMVVRGELYFQLGGLDADFFAHMEEIDLCWRMQRAGYQIVYMGKSRVYHVGGATLSKSNPRKTYLNFRNGLSLLLINLSVSQLVWKLPLRILLDWIAGCMFMLKGSVADAFAVAKAHWHFIGKARRDVRKRRNHGRTPPFYPRSIVLDYFLLGKKRFDRLDF
jgi:GT2 family glycosyltransferase